MMKNGLTIYDISKLSGVSVATVSRVLNGNTRVNEQTRERVNSVISRYDYVPKQSARNFKERELCAVGLLMDDIRNPYMASFAFFINREFSRLKMNTVLCNIHDVESEFVGQVDNMIDKKVNGIIMMSSIFQTKYCRVLLDGRYSGVPFVAINSSFGLPNVCEVILDQQTGVEEAVRYLVGLGRRHIGLIYKKQSRSDECKFAGFLDGMQGCGLRTERMMRVVEKTIESGMQATSQMMTRWPDTDAIIYSSDTLAVGGAHCLNRAGVPIPERVMIIGFNNSASACDCYPQLTSIDNNINEAASTAAQMMLKMINGEETEDVLIPSKLVVREST